MKTKLTLKWIKIDNPKVHKAFDKAIKKEIENAARQWLKAVLTRVPVYTGEARGSLIHVGKYLQVPIPIARNPNADKHGHKNRGPEDGLFKSSFKIEHLKTVQRFSYQTDVFHFIFNEHNDANEYGFHLTHLPRPWEAFVAGEKAFNQYIDDNLKQNLPKLKYFFKEYQAYVED